MAMQHAGRSPRSACRRWGTECHLAAAAIGRTARLSRPAPRQRQRCVPARALGWFDEPIEARDPVDPSPELYNEGACQPASQPASQRSDGAACSTCWSADGLKAMCHHALSVIHRALTSCPAPNACTAIRRLQADPCLRAHLWLGRLRSSVGHAGHQRHHLLPCSEPGGPG